MIPPVRSKPFVGALRKGAARDIEVAPVRHPGQRPL